MQNAAGGARCKRASRNDVRSRIHREHTGNTYIEQGFTLHATGGAELRSTFETVSAGGGNSVVSDYYGAFEWYSDDTIAGRGAEQRTRGIPSPSGARREAS